MLYDAWYQKHGIWMVYGIWYMVYGIWYMVYDSWNMVHSAAECVHLGLRIWILGFRVGRAGFGMLGLRLVVQGLGLRIFGEVECYAANCIHLSIVFRFHMTGSRVKRGLTLQNLMLRI